MTATPIKPERQKRGASAESEQASLGTVSKRLKRIGQRFPISSRLIPSTVLFRSTSTIDLVPMSDTDSDTLPEAPLPFSAATLEYVLQFLENRPVVVRDLAFPRDWETMRALSELSTNWLLERATHLHATRNAALSTLVAFDDSYECEHSCRGVVWTSFAQAFTTTNKRKLRKMSEDDRAFDCKDCDVMQ
ncbi:hypothetical protein Rt10032_c01g0601 [Rhodotorula toruloides]|uniref:Uncharacterized protein n=1 Tax=Rhodotorula toruloides TaxID=5286 RepID=A0A511KAX6_RHOTO|nr:hypothetical protein Rt10032_c01g0601 [Rhodotorula toruloides]